MEEKTAGLPLSKMGMNIREVQSRPMVKAHLILKKEDSILFQWQEQATTYALPMISIEGNASMTKELIKKINELTAIVISPSNLHLVHVHSQNINRLILHFFFRCNWDGQIVDLPKPLSFFPLQSLPCPLMEPLSCILEKIERSIFYSEMGE
ncbi:hypothetical protein PHSC3_001789 [Chlamydiales bacterium STE3]|nr:hypothetical protein PHSC3_001789 [Chlamydiales bacterium STE3]